MPPSLSASPARPRRSLLSVPCVNRRALDKTRELDCDGVIFDLEDSVAPERKAEARDNLRQFFRETSTSRWERVIRVNGAASEFIKADMDLVLELAPDAVLLPKVGDADEVRSAAAFLSKEGASQALRLWAMMETPAGILNAATIAAAGRSSGRLDCFVMGLNDLRKETGVQPEPGRTYLVPWLMQAVLAARAYGFDVIDSVFNDFRDTKGLEMECIQGRAMGFDGKMLIHPSQIEVANRLFGPDPKAVEEAEIIVEAFSQPSAEKLNVINMNGRMVERLHLEQAERLLARFQAISIRKAKV